MYEAESNIEIVCRERGKIVARRESHNIWLNTGRTWLSTLVAASAFEPFTVLEEDNRLAYIGWGIGGRKQDALSVANNVPLLPHYPGTNVQDDLDVAVLQIERPVRVGWVGPNTPTGVYPNLTYDAGDVWRTEMQVPAFHSPLSMVRLTAQFADSDITSALFKQVPLSEIGLFHYGAGLNTWNSAPVAYDCFPSIPKTTDMTILVTWTIRF